jgi:hypothetical protein
VDRSQEEGDQVLECRLKSLRRSVGTVGSRSKERRVFSEVVSSTLTLDLGHVFERLLITQEIKY